MKVYIDENLLGGGVLRLVPVGIPLNGQTIYKGYPIDPEIPFPVPKRDLASNERAE